MMFIVVRSRISPMDLYSFSLNMVIFLYILSTSHCRGDNRQLLNYCGLISTSTLPNRGRYGRRECYPTDEILQRCCFGYKSNNKYGNDPRARGTIKSIDQLIGQIMIKPTCISAQPSQYVRSLHTDILESYISIIAKCLSQ